MAVFQNLYIHVPFCRKKCAYCAFYSEPDASRSLMEAWLDKITRQLHENSSSLQNLHTVYFGGGTPSLLPPELWKKLIEAAGKEIKCCPDAEITMEANPETVTPELCHTVSGFINRVSMGVQSFQPRLLKAAGRNNADPDTALKALELWHAAGITNCGFDLIYALPGQTLADFEQDLKTALSAGIRHLSAYSLTVEENTPLFKTGFSTDEDLSAEMWSSAGEICQAYGFPRYEISNYASGPWQARHNQNIWHGETYLGLGPSACGFDGTDRYTEPPSVTDWLNGKAPERDHIPRDERVREIFLMGLRTVRGWSAVEFRNAAGADPDFPELDDLEKQGLIARSSGTIAPTEKGLTFWNEIALALL